MSFAKSSVRLLSKNSKRYSAILTRDSRSEPKCKTDCCDRKKLSLVAKEVKDSTRLLNGWVLVDGNVYDSTIEASQPRVRTSRQRCWDSRGAQAPLAGRKS